MGRRPIDPLAASAPPLDPTELPDGTDRVLLFRAAAPPPPRTGRRRSGQGDVDGRLGQRMASGLVGIFYRGESLRDLEERALAEHGPGRYRLVVQRMADGCWTYVTSTVRAIGAELPPEPGEGPDDGPDDAPAAARQKPGEGLTGNGP